MFQSLNIFKSPAHAVIPAGTGFDVTENVRVASPAADAAIIKRGTVENLKSVKGPTREELEQDFAFITDILSKAGPTAEPLQRRQAPTRVMDPAKTKVYKPDVPTYVPHHKRSKAVNGDQPVFAVQSDPRPAQPDFLRASLQEDTEAQEVALSAQDYDVADFWGASEEPSQSEPAELVDHDHSAPVTDHQSDESARVEFETTAGQTGEGAKVLDGVPVDVVSDVIASIMTEADLGSTPGSDPSLREMGLFRRMVSIAPRKQISEGGTDAYDFGPELPRWLCRLLARFIGTNVEEDLFAAS